MGEPDPRPAVWVGHITMTTPDLPETKEFMLALGMRFIAEGAGFVVLELRGGTHLVLLPSEEKALGGADFDLMVDDLESFRARTAELGLAPSPIREGTIHHSFTLDSPSGHTITVNSTHVSELPV